MTSALSDLKYQATQTASGERDERSSLDWAKFLALALLFQYVNFAQNAKSIGLFNDEWELFGRLHFLPHSLSEYTMATLMHPRLVIRPVLAVIFGPAYYFFGENAAAYHWMNQLVELVGAQFLYLALAHLTKQRLFSCLAAVLFLIYPNHDFTHYSVTGMVQNIALTLSIVSLWWLARRKDYSWHAFILPWVLMAVGFCTYENCIPLIGLLPLAIIWRMREQGASLRNIIRPVLTLMVPMVALTGAFVCFRSTILPMLGFSPMYKSAFSAKHAIEVLVAGVNVSLWIPGFQFFAGLARDVVQAGLSRKDLLQLLTVSLALAGSLFHFLPKKESNSSIKSFCIPLLFGLIAFFSAYSTYTLAPDYMPVLDSNFNRINSAASLGAAITLAAVLCLIAGLFPWRRAANLALIMVAVPVSILFTLSNWEFSKPWLASSAVQSHIISIVKEHAATINGFDSIILVNTPRYVRWASLFDSVWDFESMVRIVTDNKNIKGGVVSERMIVDRDTVTDMSCGEVCGKYPFKKLVLLRPNPDSLTPVTSGEDFISFVRANGLGFGLDPRCPDRWEQELAASRADLQEGAVAPPALPGGSRQKR